MTSEERLESDNFLVISAALGSSEYAFAKAVAVELANDQRVKRAYLAVCRINGGAPEVSLCLRFQADEVDQSVLSRCGRVFRSMFNFREALAIVPLNMRMEEALHHVAPFYSTVDGQSTL